MILIRKRRLQAEFPKSLPMVLVSELRGEFTPLITSVKREYWTKLGLPFPDSLAPVPNPDLAGGELYLSKSGNLLYFKIPADRGLLECGCILRNGEVGEFNAFFESVKTLVQRELKAREVQWENVTVEEAFSALSSRGISMKPAKEEISVARELEDPNLLRFLLRAQNASSLSARDLTNLDDRRTAEPNLEKLVRFGLMSKDFVVLCREKGQQIMKVPSKQAIEETSQKGFKCFLCGKPISEESVEELLSATELGRRMVDKGYWMPVRILDGLMKLGVKERDVVADGEDGFYTLYFHAAEKIVLIAVFDRKLTLSDAYTLNAKLSVNQAGMGIVVGTQGISPVIKQFLVQHNGAEEGRTLHFLESLTGIEDRLEQILQLRQQEDIRSIVEPFSQLTPVVLRDLICQKLFGGEAEIKKPQAPQQPIRKGRGSKEDSEEEERAKV